MKNKVHVECTNFSSPFVKFGNDIPKLVASKYYFDNLVYHSTTINISLQPKPFKAKAQIGQPCAKTKLASSNSTISNIPTYSCCRLNLSPASETSISALAEIYWLAHPTSTSALNHLLDLAFLANFLYSSEAFLDLPAVLLMYLTFPMMSSNFCFSISNSASYFLTLHSISPADFLPITWDIINRMYAPFIEGWLLIPTFVYYEATFTNFRLVKKKPAQSLGSLTTSAEIISAMTGKNHSWTFPQPIIRLHPRLQLYNWNLDWE